MSKEKEFLKLVTKEFDTITKKERKEFREFMRLNGRHDLTQRETRLVSKKITRFVENKELKERYYIFHFLSLANSQWVRFPLEETIFNYYKNCDKLQSIYLSVFGKEKLCENCSGRGYVLAGDQETDCPDCGGDGK